MSENTLRTLYEQYIQCLNDQNWPALGNSVHEDVFYNDKKVGLTGYRSMLENDFEQIPDLHFNIALLVVDEQCVAARLDFACTPKGTFLGLPVNGKPVRFSENVFYRFRDGKIERVWSVIDKAAVEAQLQD